MKKIVLSVALLGSVLAANAQCGSVGPAIRALTQDKISEAKSLFEKAAAEIKDADAKGSPVEAKCYARYYYGAGATTLQEFQSQPNLDNVTKVALLNKAEKFFAEFFSLEYEDKSYRAKAVTDLEAVANRQKEVAYDFFQNGDYETAFNLFEKCLINKAKLGVDHLDLHAYKSASITASRLGDFDKALEYNEILIKNPSLKVGPEVNKQDQNLTKKAELLGNLGRTEEALKVLDSAKTVFPGNTSIEMQQLRIYMDVQDNDGAIDVLESITQKITDRDDLYVIMGQIYGERGDSEKSKEAYQKALGINAQSINALYGMGAYYVNKSNEYVQNLNNVGNSQSDQKAKAGTVEERERNFNNAIKYFEMLLEVDPKDRSTLNALKKIYDQKMQNADDATKADLKTKIDAINEKLLAE